MWTRRTGGSVGFPPASGQAPRGVCATTGGRVARSSAGMRDTEGGTTIATVGTRGHQLNRGLTCSTGGDVCPVAAHPISCQQSPAPPGHSISPPPQQSGPPRGIDWPTATGSTAPPASLRRRTITVTTTLLKCVDCPLYDLLYCLPGFKPFFQQR